MPLGGEWKTGPRVQKERSLVAIGLHLPADPAVPFAGVQRPARSSASFASDVSVVQTERRDYVPGWLWRRPRCSCSPSARSSSAPSLPTSRALSPTNLVT